MNARGIFSRIMGRQSGLDIALLLIFAAGAFVVFNQKPAPTPQTTNLLEGLEFFFSIALGWVLQRVYSRRLYEEDLRRYAFSAYRRISDIRNSVVRLDAQIKRHIESLPEEYAHLLETFQVLADEMKDTVQSSVADWAEIIGVEIKKAEKLRELESKRVAPRDASADTYLVAQAERIEQIEEEIGKLRSELPLYLQLAVSGQPDTLPRGGRVSPYVKAHFENSLRAQGRIILEVDPRFDISDGHVIEEIQKRAPFYVWEDVAMGTSYLMVVDREGSEIGEVVNIFDKAGVYHRDFQETIFAYLPEGMPHEYLGGVPGRELPDSRLERVDTEENKAYVSFNPERVDGE